MRYVTAINKKTGEVLFFESRRSAAKLLGDKPYYEQKVVKIISPKCSECSYKGRVFYDGKLNVPEMYEEYKAAGRRNRGCKKEPQPVIGTNIATGIQVRFKSISEAARFVGVRPGAVSAVVSAPDRRQTAGFVFELI